MTIKAFSLKRLYGFIVFMLLQMHKDVFEISW
jgi:hypothetical protein